MVQLGLDAVLAGTPSSICKTKVGVSAIEWLPSRQGAWCRCGKPLCALQVVCTLGPMSRSVEVIEELLRAGMNVARFNFSHGSHEYHKVISRGPAGQGTQRHSSYRGTGLRPAGLTQQTAEGLQLVCHSSQTMQQEAVGHQRCAWVDTQAQGLGHPTMHLQRQALPAAAWATPGLVRACGRHQLLLWLPAACRRRWTTCARPWRTPRSCAPSCWTPRWGVGGMKKEERGHGQLDSGSSWFSAGHRQLSGVPAAPIAAS